MKTKNIAIATAMTFCMMAMTSLATAQNIFQNMQDVSVMIRTGGHTVGSALIVERQIPGPAGTTVQTTFLISCAHVFQGLDSGMSYTAAKHYFSGNNCTQCRTVECPCHVIFIDKTNDLAILTVATNIFNKGSVRFPDESQTPPQLGDKLFHIGCFFGDVGSCSLSTGIVSKIGRVIKGVSYDQTNCDIFPGSSGGGIFNEKGECVGIALASIAKEQGQKGFGLYVPIRKMREVFNKAGFGWVLK